MPQRLDWRAAASRGRGAYLRELARLFLTRRGRKKPDVILCGHLHLLPLAVLAKVLWRRPVWQIIHGIEAWEATGRKPSRFALRRIDRLLSVSQFTRDRFAAWTGTQEIPWTWLPNSIDLHRFTPGPRCPSLTARCGLEGKTVLMTLCRLSSAERYKGVDEILGLMPSLLQEIPHLHYLICGGGDDLPRLVARAKSLGLNVHNRTEDGKNTQTVPSSASQHFGVSAFQHSSVSTLSSSVTFTGRIPESEKVNYYRLAQAFAMPGHGEGFGIVYLEAMACGVPVVASSADASQEVVRHCASGEIVNPADPADLHRGLLAALTTRNPPTQKNLSLFGWEAFRDRIAKLVQPEASETEGKKLKR